MAFNWVKMQDELKSREARIAAIRQLVTPYLRYSGNPYPDDSEAGFEAGQRAMAKEVLGIFAKESPFDEALKNPENTEREAVTLRHKAAKWHLGNIQRHVQNVPRNPSNETYEDVFGIIYTHASEKGEGATAYEIRCILNRPFNG